MVFDCALCITIVAVDHCLGILKLWWHRLAINSAVEIAELCFHVDNTFAANRAFIRRFQMIVVALVVYAVTAIHEHNGLGRGKHILAANGAVAVSGALDASMGGFNRDGHAHAACLEDSQHYSHDRTKFY